MSCGTVAAMDGIRLARVFEMTPCDPRRKRSTGHRYALLIATHFTSCPW